MEEDPDCGENTRAWLARYDPESSSWRTSQRSLLADSGESLETFAVSGMMRNGRLYPRETPVRPTCASACSSSLSLPTPTARDYKDSGPNVNYPALKKKARLAGHLCGPPSPLFVEWLMGFPPGWLGFDRSETRSSPESPRSWVGERSESSVEEASAMTPGDCAHE